MKGMSHAYLHTTNLHILPRHLNMFSKNALLALSLLVTSSAALPSLHARQLSTNECPTDTEYACFDVINSSLCVSSTALRNGTAAELAQCVTYPGGMSDLPGASKVSAETHLIK
jgi:hypothetical protein